MAVIDFDDWADVLTGYSTEIKPGETVGISGGVAAEELLSAIYRSVLRRGGLPLQSEHRS